MAEESSESITHSDPELTKEEYLERHVWTLQYYFEELLKADKGMANDFITWATGELIDAYAPGDSETTDKKVS